MAQKTFNEAEVFVMQNWSTARRLEKAMERIRQEKYKTIIERAASEAAEQLKTEFEDIKYEVYPTQHWEDGYVSFWCGDWESSKRIHPTFGIGGLRLEHLLSDEPDRESPYGYVWLKEMKKAGWDLQKLRKRLLAQTKSILKDFPRLGDDDPQLVWYFLPEGKKEIRKLLLEDEGSFTQLLVSNVLKLAELAPAITKVLAAGPKKSQ